MDKIKISLDNGAVMPTRAYKNDAGIDLYSKERQWVRANDSAAFDTGVHIDIPSGYVGMVKSKSGLNVKHGITSEGVIDSGYTGSICIKLYNHSSKNHLIELGDKISQLVILPIVTPKLELVESKDDFENNERGENGFGSTGK